MKILQRYLAEHVLYAILLVLLILFGIQIFAGLMAELKDIGSGNYNMGQAILYVFRMLPTDMYEFFPMGGLIGSLLGLGYLATNSELIVMRTSGFSLRSLIGTVLSVAVVLLIVMTFLGEYVAPHAAHRALLYKEMAKSKGQMAATVQGLWLRDKNVYIRIQQVMPGKYLKGISQYAFDADHRLVKASFAKDAVYENNKWVLRSVAQTYLKGNAAPKTSYFDRLIMPVRIRPALLKMTDVGSETLSLVQLWRIISFNQKNGLDARQFSLAFWQRVLKPFSTLLMIFLAIPFVLGPLRSSPMGFKIVVGVAIGFVFYILDHFFGPFCLVYQIPPFFGAFIPIMIFFVIGLFLTKRVS